MVDDLFTNTSHFQLIQSDIGLLSWIFFFLFSGWTFIVFLIAGLIQVFFNKHYGILKKNVVLCAWK